MRFYELYKMFVQRVENVFVWVVWNVCTVSRFIIYYGYAVRQDLYIKIKSMSTQTNFQWRTHVRISHVKALENGSKKHVNWLKN